MFLTSSDLAPLLAMLRDSHLPCKRETGEGRGSRISLSGMKLRGREAEGAAAQRLAASWGAGTSPQPRVPGPGPKSTDGPGAPGGQDKPSEPSKAEGSGAPGGTPRRRGGLARLTRAAEGDTMPPP